MDGNRIKVSIGGTDIEKVVTHSLQINGSQIEKNNTDDGGWKQLVAGNDVDISASIEGELGAPKENGSLFLVSVGGTAVAAQRGGNLSISQELRDESHKTSRYPVRKSGKKMWSASLSTLTDLANTQHKALITAADQQTHVTLSIGPATPATGDYTFSGDGAVNVNSENPDGDTATLSVDITGNGALTKTEEGSFTNNGVIQFLDDLLAGTQVTYLITNEDAAIGDLETISLPFQIESIELSFEKNDVVKISANLQLAAEPTFTNKAA